MAVRRVGIRGTTGVTLRGESITPGPLPESGFVYP